MAFRRLSRHFHPDKNAAPHAAAVFEALRGALDQLKDGTWRTASGDDLTRRFFTDAAPICVIECFTHL